MVYGPISNPFIHLDKILPYEPKLGRGGQALKRRIAKFEAQRAQEATMAQPAPQIADLNPVAHQTKATFTPNKSLAQPPPRQVLPRPADARVQRVRPMEAPEPSAFEADLINDLETEFGTEAPEVPAAETPTESDTEDIDAILKRYKGSPDEIAKKIAKSYAESEKRMRHVEAEKQLLLKQGVQPQAAPQPAPVPQQIQVQPVFNYKRFKDDMLDRGDEVAKEFEAHVTGTLDQKMAQVIAPLYEEAIDNRLFRKYGEVVTEDNLDLIKAMAQSEPGNNRWEKMVSAVTKYKTSMPGITPSQLPEVAEMQRQASMPSPQARTGGEKKMYKQSDLQTIMQKKMKTGEWQRDPKWSNLVNAAYRDGRVLRGQ